MSRLTHLAITAAFVIAGLAVTTSCGTTSTPTPAPRPTLSSTPWISPTPTPTRKATPVRSPSSTPTPRPVKSTTATPSPATDSVGVRDLVSSEGFRKVEQQANGTISLALVQLTPSGTRAGSVQVGSWRTGAAWSTMKIPVAMAALAEQDDAATRALVRRAITTSDNSAALTLWQGLGPASVAGPQVQQQLALRGDSTTEVQQKVTRSGFSAFGQTQWALEDQATFAARLVCSPRPKVVLQDMRRITSSQRWGLGHISGAAIKGGWGPLSSGAGYTARQLAVMQTDEGSTWGVAVSSENSAGFQAAVQDLDRTSAWLSRQFESQQLRISTAELRARDCS